MSLDPPPYLASLQNNIRQRPIPWDGAARAGTITDGQLAKIRAVDKARKEQRKQVVEGDLDAYRILFVGDQGNPSILESASRRSDVVQYVLVLLSDLLGSTYIHSLPFPRFLFFVNLSIKYCPVSSLLNCNSCTESGDGSVQRLRSISTLPTSTRPLEQL